MFTQRGHISQKVSLRQVTHDFIVNGFHQDIQKASNRMPLSWENQKELSKQSKLNVPGDQR